MSKAASVVLAALIVLLSSGRPAEAVPVLYTLSGEIQEMGGSSIWALGGSFLLSDPTITYNLYDDPAGSPYIEDLARYSLLDLTLQSSVFNTAGIGSLSLKARDTVDRFFWLDVTGFGFSASSFGAEPAYPLFDGSLSTPVYEQPQSISSSFFLSGVSGGARYRVTLDARRTAAVPEPATWTLIGLGLAGFIARRRRA